MFWQRGHVSVFKGVEWSTFMGEKERRISTLSTLYTEGQTLSWNFLNSSVPAPEQSYASPFPPLRHRRVLEKSMTETPWGCEQLGKETMLHSSLISIRSKSNNIWKNKMSLSYVAWFMTILQVLHLSPKALYLSPSEPKGPTEVLIALRFCGEMSSTNSEDPQMFIDFHQFPGLGCLDLFRSKASWIISRACNGWIMPPQRKSSSNLVECNKKQERTISWT